MQSQLFILLNASVDAQVSVYLSAWCTAGGDTSPPSLKRSEGINNSTLSYLDTHVRGEGGKWDIQV